MTERIIIDRSRYGHIVTVDPSLVERAKRAIRWRRDRETSVRMAG